MTKKLEIRSLLLLWGAALAVLFFMAAEVKTAQAVTVMTDMDGKLVKSSQPQVYFIGSDDKKYVFPNEKVFHSWYKDFSTVQVISDDELTEYQLGGHVIYRPGARLVKTPGDPKVYAVATDGMLRWVSTEEIAKALFGDNWAKQVDDVPETFVSSYQVGADINNANDYLPAGETTETPASTPISEEGVIPDETSKPDTDSSEANAVFKVVSHEVLKIDEHENEAEDVRSFVFEFNKPPTGARITIVEKSSNKLFFSEAANGNEQGSKILAFIPDNWPAKLKSNTAYGWKLVAYSAPNATRDQMVTVYGDFTTSDFTNSTPTTNGTGSETPAVGTGTGTGTTPGTVIGNTTPATGDTSGTVSGETAPFKILSVKVDKVDASGKTSEEVRSFGITFSEEAKGVRLMITEKESGTVFYSEPVADGAVLAASTYISPGNWKAKLKPSTTYIWKVVAYSAKETSSARLVYDIMTGEFTTTNFVPRTTPLTTAAYTVVSTTIDKVNENNIPVEDVRRFKIIFSAAPNDKPHLVIAEKNTGYTVLSLDLPSGHSELIEYSSMGGNKLKPSTAYSWAIGPDAAIEDRKNLASGEFVTTNFIPAVSTSTGL